LAKIAVEVDEQEWRIFRDIIKKLQETKQVYIECHDYPISVSRWAFDLFDLARRQMAKKEGIPEEQYEFEDLIFDLFLPPGRKSHIK